jgi:hypothetical protein
LMKEACDKAVAALTTKHVEPRGGWLLDWGDQAVKGEVEYLLTRSNTEKQLVRTVEELFAGNLYTDVDRHRCIFPSTSASYQDTKAQGGCFRSIRKFAFENGLCSRGTRTEVKRKDGTVKNEYKPPAPRVKFSVRDQKGPGVPVVDVDMVPIELLSEEMYEKMLPAALAEPGMVKPVALAESLKVRIITKGAPLTTKVLHPLQKFLHGILRKHPVFKFTGDVVSAFDVQSRLGKKLEDDEVYVSGDYSAATDNLAPWVSECIARAIARVCKLRPEEEILLLKSLTGNIFV